MFGMLLRHLIGHYTLKDDALSPKFMYNEENYKNAKQNE